MRCLSVGQPRCALLWFKVAQTYLSQAIFLQRKAVQQAIQEHMERFTSDLLSFGIAANRLFVLNTRRCKLPFNFHASFVLSVEYLVVSRHTIRSMRRMYWSNHVANW